jgi:hypothetical protein
MQGPLPCESIYLYFRKRGTDDGIFFTSGRRTRTPAGAQTLHARVPTGPPDHLVRGAVGKKRYRNIGTFENEHTQSEIKRKWLGAGSLFRGRLVEILPRLQDLFYGFTCQMVKNSSAPRTNPRKMRSHSLLPPGEARKRSSHQLCACQRGKIHICPRRCCRRWRRSGLGRWCGHEPVGWPWPGA